MSTTKTTLKKETKMADSVDLRNAKAEFAKTFAAFKAANDERLVALEAKRSGDSLLEEKVERLNAALDQQSKTIHQLSVNGQAPA
ncbi:MAG TPA: phage major capsid protein, partial [Hellea balneolensis]|nr:phage major capsid protein [Hellea balneolensis]